MACLHDTVRRLTCSGKLFVPGDAVVFADVAFKEPHRGCCRIFERQRRKSYLIPPWASVELKSRLCNLSETTKLSSKHRSSWDRNAIFSDSQLRTFRSMHPIALELGDSIPAPEISPCSSCSVVSERVGGTDIPSATMLAAGLSSGCK